MFRTIKTSKNKSTRKEALNETIKNKSETITN